MIVEMYRILLNIFLSFFAMLLFYCVLPSIYVLNCITIPISGLNKQHPFWLIEKYAKH